MLDIGNVTVMEISIAHDILSYILSSITLWRILIFLLVLGNVKNIPLIWHLRIVNAFRFCCKTQRPKDPVTPAHLFQPLITTSHAPIMEIDFNFHKTNSSYFSDIDIARTHLVCTLFSTGIEEMRGGTAGWNPGNRPLFGLALGAVSCSFRRELKPYETYEMWTRILSWDEKWVYIVTHFVKKDAVLPAGYSLYPQQNSSTGPGADMRKSSSSSTIDTMACNDAVVATALSKCVFKQGRRTVSPSLMLRQSNLLPQRSLDDLLANEMEETESLSSTSSDSGIEMDDEERARMCAIERERRRGIKIATTLAAQGQSALELEFRPDGEALGRHTDGTGVSGVFSTLLNLAHIKKHQVL
ncbi:hypothetical protein BJ878DRAFT_115186 [Calycina marina]|uniref:Capsule polysaccharide biosynthesis protein n=1 Tax=Calycina marina TaxID=1763456 RepID=A0A9P7Z1Q5_9HELO|nr:hypothetical protein BJ878DRAFT_115186 [Calycina marina]